MLTTFLFLNFQAQPEEHFDVERLRKRAANIAGVEWLTGGKSKVAAAGTSLTGVYNRVTSTSGLDTRVTSSNRVDLPDGKGKRSAPPSGSVINIETAVFVDKDLVKYMSTIFAEHTEQELVKFVLTMVNAVSCILFVPVICFWTI